MMQMKKTSGFGKCNKLIFIFAIVLLTYSFKPKEITWVAIGDSITFLNDHLNETGNRVSKGYMTRVAEQLPNLHYINQGHSGWNSGSIAGALDTLGIVKADLYSVFLGTNDWWKGRPLGTLTDYQNNTGNGTVNGSFRIIIDRLKKLNKTAKIVLITPMQRADFVFLWDKKNNAYGSYKQKNGQTLAQFAEAVNAIGKYERIKVVDLYNKSGMEQETLIKYKRLRDPLTTEYKNYPYPSYINIPFNPATDEYPYPPDAAGYTYDGLHPSDKGNAIIADQLVKVFKKIKIEP